MPTACTECCSLPLDWNVQATPNHPGTHVSLFVASMTAALNYKLIYGLAPTYLSDLIQLYVSSRSLRSVDQLILQVAKTRLSIADMQLYHTFYICR